MDAERFDRLASSIALSVTRRRAVEGILAGTAGFLAFDTESNAKKRRRKKRCKPKPVRSTCQKTRQCCRKKSGRVCASNARTLGCNQTSNVCCLPVGSLGCTDTCDCCGGDAIACDLGPGRCDFL